VWLPNVMHVLYSISIAIQQKMCSLMVAFHTFFVIRMLLSCSSLLC
jgi:hypothetical protein